MLSESKTSEYGDIIIRGCPFSQQGREEGSAVAGEGRDKEAAIKAYRDHRSDIKKRKRRRNVWPTPERENFTGVSELLEPFDGFQNS